MKRTVVVSLFVAFTGISCSQDDGENNSMSDADVDTGSLADGSTDAADSDDSLDLGDDVNTIPDMSCETERFAADPQNLMTCNVFCDGLGLFCDPTAPPLSFKKGGVASYDNGVSSYFGCDVVPEAMDGEAVIEGFGCYCTCAEQS